MKFAATAVTIAIIGTMLFVGHTTAQENPTATADASAAHYRGGGGDRGDHHRPRGDDRRDDGDDDRHWREVPNGSLPPMFPLPRPDHHGEGGSGSHSGSWSHSEEQKHDDQDHHNSNQNPRGDHSGSSAASADGKKGHYNQDENEKGHGRHIDGMLMLVGMVCALIGTLVTLVYCIRSRCCKKQVTTDSVDKIVVAVEYDEEENANREKVAGAVVDGIVIGNGEDSHHPMKPASSKKEDPPLVVAALY